MSRLTVVRRIALGILAAAVTLLPTTRMFAQASCGSTCDFKDDRTTIRDYLWNGPCDASIAQRYDRRYHGDGARAPETFVRGVCLFEQIARGRARADSADPRGMRLVTAAIEELQKAQSVFMLASQRTVAALFEGLMHCKQLDLLAAAPGAGGPGSLERRCAHRAMAKASFARVDHAGLDLRYTDAEGAARVDQNIESMLTCQEVHLHDGQASACGILLSANDAELNQVANDVAKDALPRFFGEIADDRDPKSKKLVPHVTALVYAKISEATAASKGAVDAFARLDARNEALRDNFGTLNARLCETPPCVPGLVAGLLSSYKAAIQSVNRYLAFIDEFSAGFFQDANKEDVRAALEKNLKEVRQTVAELAPKHTALSSLKQDLDRLSRDPAGLEAIRSACRLLFCDIYAGPKIRLDNACRSIDATRREPLTAFNPLCRSDATTQVIENGATTASICREAGFDPALTVCGD